ncbi:MAG: energy transducer TonB [Candidatus Eisenbacteria bacterium]|nr:energy transducer TonB [Candidatus Eisenbacteria bacterium]
MRHGIDGYFGEIAHFQRRLSLFGAAVSAALLLLLAVLRQPAMREMLDDSRRFGFEGPDQYVERILLELRGPEEQLGRNSMSAAPVSRRESGGRRPARAQGTVPTPRAERRGRDAGEDAFTLEARLRAMALEGPIVQSEDLVVENLVRPDYPEEARLKDIEGLVELVALVDTTGRVAQVEIIGGARHPLLEHAATTAVLQCRYRPYRSGGSLQPVWAYFRINFRLY